MFGRKKKSKDCNDDIFTGDISIDNFTMYPMPDLIKRLHESDRKKEARLNLIQESKMLIDNGKYSSAIKKIEKILGITPNNLKALYMMGVSLYFLEKYDDAMTYFDNVLTIDPNHFDSIMFKQLIFIKMEKIYEAFVLAEKILIDNPENVISLSNKALALAMKDDYDDALRIIEQALRIEPNNKESLLLKQKILQMKRDPQYLSQNFMIDR